MKVEKEAPQTNSQSEANAVAEPSENKESEKPELPMTKQENYQLHYDQPTAPSYDGWENKPCLSETVKWGLRFLD